MKRNKGASLAQYIIVIALIALAIVPVYYFAGKGIVENLTSFYNALKANNSQVDQNVALSVLGNAIKTGAVKAGQLGGQPDDPVRECVGEVCAIDYGSIVINGIPADFSSFTEISGSNGTGEVLALLQQLADQINNDPDMTPDEKLKIEKLMARGKEILNLEKTYDERYKLLEANKAQLAQYQADKVALYQKKFDGTLTSAQFSQERKAFEEKYANEIQVLSQLNDSVSIDLNGKTESILIQDLSKLLAPEQRYVTFSEQGCAVADDSPQNSLNGVELSTVYENYLTGDFKLSTDNYNNPYNAGTVVLSPVGGYISELKSVLNDNEIKGPAKDVSKILSKEIFTISDRVQKISSILSEYARTTVVPFYMNETELNQTQERLEGLSGTVQSSKNATGTTRIDLAIICGSHRGEFNKDNETCKKAGY